jgi:predicted PurR-regulated permease PerM
MEKETLKSIPNLLDNLLDTVKNFSLKIQELIDSEKLASTIQSIKSTTTESRVQSIFESVFQNTFGTLMNTITKYITIIGVSLFLIVLLMLLMTVSIL